MKRDTPQIIVVSAALAVFALLAIMIPLFPPKQLVPKPSIEYQKEHIKKVEFAPVESGRDKG